MGGALVEVERGRGRCEQAVALTARSRYCGTAVHTGLEPEREQRSAPALPWTGGTGACDSA